MHSQSSLWLFPASRIGRIFGQQEETARQELNYEGLERNWLIAYIITWSGVRESDPLWRFGRPLPKRLAYPAKFGGDGINRRFNLPIIGRVLCHLSYATKTGADAANRTRVSCVPGKNSATELHRQTWCRVRELNPRL